MRKPKLKISNNHSTKSESFKSAALDRYKHIYSKLSKDSFIKSADAINKQNNIGQDYDWLMETELCYCIDKWSSIKHIPGNPRLNSII